MAGNSGQRAVGFSAYRQRHDDPERYYTEVSREEARERLALLQGKPDEIEAMLNLMGYQKDQ